MDDEDSPPRYHRLGSARLPVKGMESVVATVSGYHGSERFNLIKMIDRAGASYVGNMSPSITHLVCWKYEGRKYELAKKFRIPIVNHCWIEECVKKGKRVSEEPYTYFSGKEIGPFVLDILLDNNQAKSQFKELKKAKRPLVETELDGIGDAVCKDPILLDEDLFPKQRQSNPCSTRSKGKAIKRNTRTCPSSSRHGLNTLLTTNIIELEEASTSQHANTCRPEKRNSISSKACSKGHRVVKKHTNLKDWLITSNMEEDCEGVKLIPKKRSPRVLLDSSEDERSPGVLLDTSNSYASNIRSTLICLESTDYHDTVQEIEQLNGVDIEEIENVSDENQNSHAHIAPSSIATSEELKVADNPDSTEKDSFQPASRELSCVICWTDFSTTRGVLPCGHRFCFSCIQNWADHMTSRSKPSTCPLCKATFVCITKVDDAVSSDQKIYSQSVPNDSSKMYILPDETYHRAANTSTPVCFRCSNREPEDLLVSCNFCENRYVHSFCLDPPLFPWTCMDCKELQMLYVLSR